MAAADILFVNNVVLHQKVKDKRYCISEMDKECVGDYSLSVCGTFVL